MRWMRDRICVPSCHLWARLGGASERVSLGTVFLSLIDNRRPFCGLLHRGRSHIVFRWRFVSLLLLLLASRAASLACSIWPGKTREMKSQRGQRGTVTPLKIFGAWVVAPPPPPRGAGPDAAHLVGAAKLLVLSRTPLTLLMLLLTFLISSSGSDRAEP